LESHRQRSWPDRIRFCEQEVHDGIVDNDNDNDDDNDND
jgi:hypothetical protein